MDLYLPDVRREQSLLRNITTVVFNSVFWIVEALTRVFGEDWGPDYIGVTTIITFTGLVVAATPFVFLFSGHGGWPPTIAGIIGYLICGGVYFLHNHDWGV